VLVFVRPGRGRGRAVARHERGRRVRPCVHRLGPRTPQRGDGARADVGRFDDLGTLPLDGYASTRFYSSTAEDTDGDGDGAYEIVLDVNTCYFSCAGGPYWQTTFGWNGTDFAPRPEAEPTDCAIEGIYDDQSYDQTAELRDITVQGTTCFEVLSVGDRYTPTAEPVVDSLIRAHDASGTGPTFDANGWHCG
jgi:hypothetical protein